MDIKATMKEALKELGFSSGDASKITEMETKLSDLQTQITTLTTERDTLKTQLSALTTENQSLKTELDTLKTGQQTEAQKTLSAARERAEKAAVAAKAENLEATKATINALTDANVLAAMAGAWETAAKSAENPDRQSNSDDPAVGEEKFDEIRAQVATRYQTGGYAGKSLKTTEATKLRKEGK
jgi:regulator of replication initiation timing